LVIVYVNDQEIWSTYWDGSYDDISCEKAYQEISKIIAEHNNQLITISGFQTGQGNRPTEDIVLNLSNSNCITIRDNFHDV
jgi:hypothetical protein